MNLKNYFTSQYLFQINTAYISPAEKLFLFSGAILVLLAIVLKVSAALAPTPADKKYRQKFFSLFATIGLSQMVWYLCRWQNVRFFGSHFIAWAIVLVAVVWFVKILISIYKTYREEKTVWEKEQVKLKYLPK